MNTLLAQFWSGSAWSGHLPPCVFLSSLGTTGAGVSKLQARSGSRAENVLTTISG